MLNKIMLIGRLGRDPDLAYTPNGIAVARFTLAVNRRSRSADGQIKEETEWFPIVAWDRLAETCNSYLHKGSKVYIEGRMQTRSYTDNNGLQRQIWEVHASEMQMLDPKPASAPAQTPTSAPAPQSTPAPEPDYPF